MRAVRVSIIQNGKPAGLFLSREGLDELTEQARFVSGVSEGLADSEAGRVHSHAEVVRRMKARFAGKAK